MAPEREKGAKAKCHVRPMDHFHDGEGERLGQALSAELLREGEPHPSTFAEPRIGLRKSRRRDHARVRQSGAGLVTHGVERRQNVTRQLVGLFQNGGHEIRVEVRKCAGSRNFIKLRDVRKRVGDL